MDEAPGRVALAGVAAVAVAVRAAHLASLLRSPIGTTLVEDAAYYHHEALRLVGAAPGATASGPSFMNLGLPYALAAIYEVTGPHVAAALAVQSALGALSAVLIAWAGAAVARDRRAGIMAGVLYALAVPAIFYDGLLLTPSLVNTALAAALVLLVRPFRRRVPSAVLAGACTGIAALVRPNVLLVAAALAIALVLLVREEEGASWAVSLRPAAAFAGAALAPALLVSGWNGLAHGQWVPVSANGGMNFYVGNASGATGIYEPAPFLGTVNPAAEARGFLEEARRRSGDAALDAAGSSRFWLRAGLADVAASPLRWLRLEGRKFVLFWNAFEVNTNVGLDFMRLFSPVLRALPTRYGVLVLLGAPGLALLCVTRPRAAGLPLALVAAPLLTVLLFFVSGEYRHPASLALAIGAGALLVALGDALRGRARLPRRGVTAAAATLVAAAPLVFWQFPPLETGCNPRYDFANFAREIVVPPPGASKPVEASFDRAEALLDRAPDAALDLVIVDARAEIETEAATATGGRGWAARAVADLTTLASHDLTPGQGGFSDAFFRNAAAGLRRRAAELSALEAVRDDPALAERAELLGADGWARVSALLREGDVSGAGAFVDRALGVSPFDTDLQAEKGRVLLHAGNEREGLAWLARSCDGWPKTPRCALYAALWHAARGRPREARAFAEEALRRDPGSREARALVARLPR